MGIFELFKKLFRQDKAEEIVIEKLAFSEIKGWIENRIKENEVKEKEILVIIREKIRKFGKEIREKIVILESVNIEAKKEKEEIKGIVNNSRKDYVKSVENFLENLYNLEMDEFEDSMKKINKIFLDFNKSSYKNYERATILVGKEMANVKEGLKVFSKELIKTFDESKGVVDSFKGTSLVKSKLDAIQVIDRTLGKISETIPALIEDIKGKEEENKKLLEEIEKIKRGSNYLERLRTQKKIESLKEELKSDIFKLEQLLDFKALANFHHIFEKEMSVIKEYKENFKQAFQKDNGENILSLLNVAKLNSEIIQEKINSIRTKIEETSTYEREIKEDETQELHSQIKIVVVEIDNLKIEKVKEEKRDEKIGANKEELIDSLKQELGKVNVEVI